MLTSSISDTRRCTTKWHEETHIVQTYIETRLRHVRGSRSRHEYDLRHVFTRATLSSEYSNFFCSPFMDCPTLIDLIVNFLRVPSCLFLLHRLYSLNLRIEIPRSLCTWRIDDRSCVNLVSIIYSTSTWLFCLSFTTDRFRSYDNSLWQKRRVIRASTRVMNRSMDWHMFVTIFLIYLKCFSPKKESYCDILYIMSNIFFIKFSDVYIYLYIYICL